MSKLAHITVGRDLAAGPSRQLRFEIRAASRITGHQWDTIAFQDVPTTCPEISRTPWLFRGMFVRNIFFWYLILKFSRTHDIVLCRHITFDPFSLIFSPFIRNRVTYHHSKEVDELPFIVPGWRGKAAAVLESFTGAVSGKFVKAFVAVTPEIASYQRIRTTKSSKPFFVVPNGIDESEIEPAIDHRREDEINIVFISGRFPAWQGLDKLFSIDQLGEYSGPKIFVHLIGVLTSEQITWAEKVRPQNLTFVVHGKLNVVKFSQLFSRADFGLGALAMERIGLKEGSTLKVREMLAAGLPVFSTHQDPSLPKIFPFYFYCQTIDLHAFCEFASSMKSYSRQEVRRQSILYISKERIMREFLNKIFDRFGEKLS